MGSHLIPHRTAMFIGYSFLWVAGRDTQTRYLSISPSMGLDTRRFWLDGDET